MSCCEHIWPTVNTLILGVISGLVAAHVIQFISSRQNLWSFRRRVGTFATKRFVIKVPRENDTWEPAGNWKGYIEQGAGYQLKFFSDCCDNCNVSWEATVDFGGPLSIIGSGRYSHKDVKTGSVGVIHVWVNPDRTLSVHTFPDNPLRNSGAPWKHKWEIEK